MANAPRPPTTATSPRNTGDTTNFQKQEQVLKESGQQQGRRTSTTIAFAKTKLTLTLDSP